jgi:opacity protein-like surface antigen
MRRQSVVVGLMLLLVHATPSTAAADWRLTPYVGGALFDIPDTGFRPGVGASFLWSGPVAGVELDVNATPDFLKGANPVALDTSGLFSLMGNAVVQFPTRSSRLRPYAVAGVGLVHTTVTTTDAAIDASRSHVGFNAGGGVTALLSPRVGVRGDVRYFRAFQDDEATAEGEALGIEQPLHFVRATVGTTFRF